MVGGIQAGIAPRKVHFNVLDSWRGVAALMVALLHFMAHSHFSVNPLIKNAGFFVDFFFVLSGFVIFANYEDRLKQGFGFMKFMFLRFGRLYPLHLATLLAFISIEVLQIIFADLQAFSKFAPFENPGESYKDIISQIFLFHALDTEPVKGFNSPSWSISAEFYTYAVFGAALILFKNKINYFCGVLFVIMPIIMAFIYVQHKELLYLEGFFRCLSGFSAGALCWMFWRNYSDMIERKNVSNLIWNVLELSILVIAYFVIKETTLTPYKYLCVLLFGFAVIVFAFEKGVISKLLGYKFFTFLGMLSYSIYMIHVFIAAKVTPPLSTILENKLGWDIFIMVDGRERIGQTMWQGDLISIFYLAVVIGCSVISYYLIEKPFRDITKNIVKKRKEKKALAATQ